VIVVNSEHNESFESKALTPRLFNSTDDDIILERRGGEDIMTGPRLRPRKMYESLGIRVLTKDQWAANLEL
jgi:hypothetical protein